MKKLYFSLSLGCFAAMGAMAQSTTPGTTPPAAGSRVTVKGTSSATSCDGTAHFDAGTIKTWKWFHDTALVQTDGADLGKLCDGNYSVQFPDSAGANMITNKFAIGVASGSTTGTNPPPSGTGSNTVTPTGSGSGGTTTGNTPPPAGSRVTVKGTSTATSCDGTAHFDAGTIKTWKWFHDTALVQTNGVDLSQLCDGNYSVQFPDSAGANIITNRFAIGVVNTAGTGTNPPPSGTGSNTVTPTGGTATGSNGGGKGTCPNFEAHAVATNVTAAGACDGTAEVVIVKVGTAPYTYKWSNSKLTTKTLTGLCAGGFQIVVTDSVGCTYTDSVHVFPYNAAKPCANFKAHVLPHNETVPGACNGSAEGVADGGVAPFTYSWSNSNITDKVNPNLCSGKVMVKIVDAKGCVASDTAMIGAVAAVNTKPCQFFAVRTLVVNDTAHTSATACGGYVEAVCKGGRGPLKFVWADNANNTTPFHKGACEGKYTVTVSDSMGCKATITTMVGGMNHPPMVTPPAPGVKPLHLFVKSMDVTNAALCNGKAKAKVEGGKAPYKFTLGASSAAGEYYTADSLCAGFYTISVMDADSATASFVFVIGSPATTFTPPVAPFVKPVIKDTLVASAISTCTINYDVIDSIRITHKNFVGTDTIKAIWTVYQKVGGNHIISQQYHLNSATGICKLVLDLFCTNRASGNVKAEDYVSLDLLSTGINTVESVKTNVYPNPFSNQVNVVCDKNNAPVFIIDLSGRTVYEGLLNAGTTTINTDHLSSGMYFINIKNDHKMITRKLVKH
jgi:Secretion system C-terminal sorting domain/SprB repeat